MPVMGGVDATRAIRALPGPAGAAPILAVTANTLPEQLAGYAEAGMDDCIAKPIDMVELVTKVIAWSQAAFPSLDGEGQAA
jgi:CheY-like chemotaxis protein